MKKKKIKNEGLLITFEGIEGSGKTTQVKKLTKWLKDNKYQSVITREPGGTSLADRIRSLLLHSKSLSPTLELLLYEVARRHHVSTIIKPALKRGKIVLCDRFTDATIAYQGDGRGLSKKMIRYLNEIATSGIKPDITFLFDLAARTGLKRARGRKKQLDRIEREKEQFHQKVRAGYLTLARKEKRRFRIINATQPPQKIFQKICRELEKVV